MNLSEGGCMMIGGLNNSFVKGAVVGVGVCAVGFYLYKKNEEKVDSFLRDQGIDIPSPAAKDFYSMSLEELMETKETIEDIIAEKELNDTNVAVCCCDESEGSENKEAVEA